MLVSRGDSGPGREGSSREKIEYAEEQIPFALRQADTGASVNEVCRKMGISENTFYRRKRKFFGISVAELRRLKQLEEENCRLKQLVAGLALDKVMLQDVLRKKSLRPARKRDVASYLSRSYRVSERRPCSVIRFARTGHRHRSRAPEQVILEYESGS